MARTRLAGQPVTPAGLAANYTAANVDGHSVATSDIVHVRNAAASAITVTIQTPATVAGLAVADQTVSVPAGGDRFIGGFRADAYAQPSGTDAGLVWVDFSAVTSVTVAALAR